MIDRVAKACYFRGVKDMRGRPRKIKGYEKNVLMCVAVNMASSINLMKSLKQSALEEKVGSGEYGYTRKSGEARLLEMLGERRKMTKAEIARQCSISFRRAMVIVDKLLEIGVLTRRHEDLGYEVYDCLLSSCP